jgi:CspA family cold shock protein
MTGKCTEFDDKKGYGHILGEDGNSYFCHFSAIQSERISLDVGEKVSFDVVDGQRGATAVMVKAI